MICYRMINMIKSNEEVKESVTLRTEAAGMTKGKNGG